MSSKLCLIQLPLTGTPKLTPMFWGTLSGPQKCRVEARKVLECGLSGFGFDGLRAAGVLGLLGRAFRLRSSESEEFKGALVVTEFRV